MWDAPLLAVAARLSLELGRCYDQLGQELKWRACGAARPPGQYRHLEQQIGDCWRRAYTCTLRRPDSVSAQPGRIVRKAARRPPKSRTVRWIERRAAQQVADMSRTTRQQVRQTLARGVERGWSVTRTANALSRVVGLRPDQEARLDRLAVEEDWSDRALEIEARRMRRERAEVIAQHELRTAANQATLLDWQEQDAAGELGDRPRKWLRVQPDACPVCQPFDGADPIPLDASFDTDNGPFDAPPLHPRCRCELVLAA